MLINSNLGSNRRLSSVVPPVYTDLLSALEGWGSGAASGAASFPIVTITNTNDSGAGSFRNILESNGNYWIRADGLSGTVNWTSTVTLGTGKKVWDLRDSDVLFKADGDTQGSIRIEPNSSGLFVAYGNFDGGKVVWDEDDEGIDIFQFHSPDHTTTANDVMFYRCSFAHSPDGDLDAPDYANGISIIECYFKETFQAINLTSTNISHVRNVSKNVRRRMPQVVNGRIYTANNAITGWNDAAIQTAKIDPLEDPHDYSEMYSEKNLWLATTAGLSVGDPKNGGKIQRGTEYKLGSTDFTFLGTDTIDSTFVTASKSKHTLVTPATYQAQIDLLGQLEQNAGHLRTGVKAVRIFGETSGTTTSPSLPASTQAGDFGILCYIGQAADGATAPLSTAPTDWTRVSTSSSGGAGVKPLRTATFVKIFTGTSTDTPSAVPTGGVFQNWKLVVLRGLNPITSYSAFWATADATGGAPANQIITATAQTGPLVVLAHVGATAAAGVSGNTITPNQMISLTTASTKQKVSMFFHNYFWDPVNYTATMSDLGGTDRQSLETVGITFA